MEKPILEAIEELATVVVMADADDQESVDAVRRSLEKLNTALPGSQLPAEIDELVKTCVSLEKRLGLFGPEADAEALIALSDAVGRLQARFGKVARSAPSGGGATTETSAPATASASAPATATPSGAFRSDSPPHQPPRASHAPVATTAMTTPTTLAATDTTTTAASKHEETSVSAQGEGEEEVSTADAPVEPPARVTRDEETIGLISEFLSESEEGLNRADQILIGAERGEANAEAVNGLFRVFHTVKGVSGFLELNEITTLAHTTETMLNRCREGTLKLADERLDLIFDATAMVRRMLGELRTAVQDSVAFRTREKLDELLERLRVQTEGPATNAGPAPAPAPPVVAPVPAVVFSKPAPAPEPPAETAQAAPSSGPDSTADGAGNSAGPDALKTTQRHAAKAAVATEQAPGEASMPAKLRETVKVDLERVDNLVAMVGELVVVEAMVVNAPEIVKAASARVRNFLSQLAKVTRDLQDVGMRMRMLPVAAVFQKMARMSRDLGRKSGKQLRLILSGESTEMDRSMVEQIADPLVHMIRNAVDHGLEPPEERRKAGKPEEGTIRLSAYHEGGSIVIELADDGRGLDREAILNKARSQGLVGPNDVLSESEIHMLIFAPGFSTAKQITEVSGRGVGMDVVKRNLDAMRGRITIATTPGHGTTFKLLLPLTLAIIDGMLVACGHDRYIIPTLSIVESIQPSPGMLITFADQHEMINVRGEILPLLRLARLFGSENAKTDPTKALVVIIEGVGRRLGLLVDEVVTQQQVVIKSLGQGLGRTKYISGAAILADGRVGLIINVEEIAGNTIERRQWTSGDAGVPAAVAF
jgi:two-component system chemotaxis sensor kinase CheA